MTWWRGENGTYGVFFNRDEKKTRSLGSPPKVESVSGTKCVFPRDPDGGGTWLLTNEHGLTLAILNAYQAGELKMDEGAVRSRGELPVVLADTRSVDELGSRMEEFDAGHYRPFSLIGIDRATEASWTSDSTGRLIEARSPLDQPVVSSSFRAKSVLPARRRMYRGLISNHKPDYRSLRQFHHWSGEASNAETPLMNRPDAQTVSICEIRMERTGMFFRYESLPDNLEGESRVTECSLVF